MSRPLIHKRIDELEAMFDAEHRASEGLWLSENELAFIEGDGDRLIGAGHLRVALD